MTDFMGIGPRHMETVRDILRQHLPEGVRVWVFGSRADGTAERYSDIDIAVEGDSALDHGTVTGLEIAFEESLLPYTVDIADLNRVSRSFRGIIDAHKVPLPLRGDSRT